jgi:hypothetical protein
MHWELVFSSPGIKLPEREADNSSPSSAEVKNAWNCTPTSLMSSWGGD